MVIHVLMLRLNQLIRLAREIGVIRTGVVVLLLALVMARINTLTGPLTYLVVTLLVLQLTLVHLFRKDKTFLQQLGIRRPMLYLAEYHALASPVTLLLLLNRHWGALSLLVATVSVIPWLSVTLLTARTGNAWSLRFIPPHAFEWKSGLRQRGGLIGSLYALALVLSPYPFATLLVIIAFTFIVTTFYNESESRQLVGVFADSPTHFLLKKGRTQLALFWSGCAPLLLIFLVVNPRYWYVLLIWGFVSSIIQLLSIHLKYSLYEPGTTLNKDVFMAIYFLSLFVPFFVPVPLVMMVHYYRRAHRNLTNYLSA